MIPVDFAANSFIVAAEAVGRNKRTDCPVYNCTTSPDRPITWTDFLDIGRKVQFSQKHPNEFLVLNFVSNSLKAYMEYPPETILWYPGGRMEGNTFLYLTRFFFLQFLPALFIDFLFIIAGKKPWLTKIQKKIFTNLNTISYFLKKQWYWDNTNYKSLLANLSPADKETFEFDSKKIDYLYYMKDWLAGSRRFILKLDDSTLPAAKRKLRIMGWLDSLLNVVFYAGVAYLIAVLLRKYSVLGGVPHAECNSCTKFELHN